MLGLLVESLDHIKRRMNIILKVLPKSVGALVKNWLERRLTDGIEDENINQDTNFLQLIPNLLSLGPVEDVTGTGSD